MTYTKKELFGAMEFGMGYVCGKHSLKLSKKERKNQLEALMKYIKSSSHKINPSEIPDGSNK